MAATEQVARKCMFCKTFFKLHSPTPFLIGSHSHFNSENDWQLLAISKFPERLALHVGYINITISKSVFITGRKTLQFSKLAKRHLKMPPKTKIILLLVTVKICTI